MAITWNRTYEVPRFTGTDAACVRRAMIAKPCPVCGAKAKRVCKRMKPGSVHMGRLPEGFDTLEVAKAGQRRRGEEK